MTFYDFLNENNLLHLWGDNNKDTPHDYTFKSGKRVWMKCENSCKHPEYDIKVYNFSNGGKCPYCSGKRVCYENSFGKLLEDIVGKNFMNKLWSKKNKLSPYELSQFSHKKIIINCMEKDYHGDYEISCAHFSNKRRCPYCSSKKVHKKDSFGQFLVDKYGEDNLHKHWSVKNTLNPFELAKTTTKQIIMICQETDYHGEYETKCSDYHSKNSRCNKCNKRVVHEKDSFAAWCIKNIGKDFLKKYWGSKNKKSAFEFPTNSKHKVWIKCQNKEYHNEYEIETGSFKKGNRCPYCSSFKVHKLDSLGTLLEKRNLNVWSEINDIDPFLTPTRTGKNLWFKCENGIHDDYIRSGDNSLKCAYRCPKCVQLREESFMQEHTRIFLESNKLKLKHEYECTLKPVNPKTKCIMPFDNEVVDLKLIIEVHGEQHYNLPSKNSSWSGNLTPEETLHKRKLYDRYKKYIAYVNGYHFLELPYWEFDEKDTYKTSINNKIKEIQKLQSE